MISREEEERAVLRRKGFSLLSVKGQPAVSFDPMEGRRIAENRLLQMGFPRWTSPASRLPLPLVRIRKRAVGARTANWERLCWIARAETVDARGPRHRLVQPAYQRAGMVLVDAETGDVLLTESWERK